MQQPTPDMQTKPSSSENEGDCRRNLRSCPFSRRTPTAIISHIAREAQMAQARPGATLPFRNGIKTRHLKRD